MSSLTLPPAAKIGLATLAALSLGTVAWAAAFDYRRRNDAAFRQKLNKQNRLSAKKSTQASAGSAAMDKAQLAQLLTTAIIAMRSERPPFTVEERESYFMDQVAMGEALANSNVIGSAVCFYKALRVYPAPQELAVIYQKTQPAAVFGLVMEMASMEDVIATATASLQASSDPRDRSDDALLTPVEPATAEEVEEDTNSSPSSGSFVHVDAEEPIAIVTDEVIVVEGAAGEVEAIAVLETIEVVGEDPPEPVLEA